MNAETHNNNYRSNILILYYGMVISPPLDVFCDFITIALCIRTLYKCAINFPETYLGRY